MFNCIGLNSYTANEYPVDPNVNQQVNLGISPHNLLAQSYLDIGFDPAVLIPGWNGFVAEQLSIHTNAGYLYIGPMSETTCNFVTGVNEYHFDKKIIVDEGIISSFDEDLHLKTDNNSNSGDKGEIQIHNNTPKTTIHGDLDITANVDTNTEGVGVGNLNIDGDLTVEGTLNLVGTTNGMIITSADGNCWQINVTPINNTQGYLMVDLVDCPE